MKFGAVVLAAVAALGLGLSSAKADLIASFDGSPTGGVTPAADVYQQYSYTFEATSSQTLVTFLFRNDPSYSALDDISVTLSSGGPNLLANPGLEQGPASGQFWPADWETVGQQGLEAAGVWSDENEGEPPFAPHSGSGYWVDGAVGGYDGLAQSVATTIGDTYDLTFWYASDPIPNGSTVGFQVYAGALPAGQQVTGGGSVPEPMSVTLLTTALVGLAGVRSRRARSANQSR